MNKIEVSEEMRSRILANVTASVSAEEIPEEPAKQPEEKKPVWKTVLKFAIPAAAIAAVILLAVILIPRLSGKGSSGAAPAADYDAIVPAGGVKADNGGELAMEVAEAEEYAPEDATMGAEGFDSAMPETKEETTLTAALSEAKNMDENKVIPGTVFYTNHHIPLTGAEYPSVTLVTSRTQLEEEFMTDSYEDSIAAQEFLSEMECSEFTDEYFQTRDVLIILVEEGSGSVSHELTAIERADEKSPWRVHIVRETPELMTADMAYWYIVAEVDKGSMADSEIEIVFE